MKTGDMRIRGKSIEEQPGRGPDLFPLALKGWRRQKLGFMIGGLQRITVPLAL